MGDEYRLKNHPLENCDDYTKNLYIDILCSVASYENSNIEAAYKLIAHIMLSAEMKHPLSEHIKNAMQITPERYSDFFLQCREQELQYIFLIDCLLIICSNGEPNKKQIEYVAAITTAFGISSKNFKCLADVTINILLQNEVYFSCSFSCDESDKETYNNDILNNDGGIKIKYNSLCYFKQFLSEVLVNSHEMFCLSYPHRKTVNFFEKTIDCNLAVLENIDIITQYSFGGTITKHYFHVERANEMIIRNSYFSSIFHKDYDYRYAPITTLRLENCFCECDSGCDLGCIRAKKIYAEKCTFKDYHYCQPLFEKEADSVTILECTFENVRLDKIFSNAIVINSTFINCSELNNPKSQYFIYSAKKNNCKFIDCR